MNRHIERKKTGDKVLNAQREKEKKVLVGSVGCQPIITRADDRAG